MHILQQLIDVKILQLKLETSMNIVAYTLNSIFQSEQINRQYKKLFALLEGGVKSLTSTNFKVPESSEVLLRLSLSGVHEHAPHVQLTIMGNHACWDNGDISIGHHAQMPWGSHYTCLTSRCGIGHLVNGLGNPLTTGAHRPL